MKKFLCFLMSALVAVTLCNCGGGDDPVPDPNPNPGPTPPGPVVEITLQNIVGEWQLTAWSGGSIIDGAHTAYLKLNADKTFDLYQVRINNQGVVLYEGTFTLDEAQALISGRYSDNVAWGASYTIALSTNAMTWTVVGKNDTSTFTKKDIPADIIDIAVPADEVRSLGEFRLL
ncbi:lipocalin family protein [uncultured Alistipes sp.]|uniref:lipocalin family protein n=1 Tax=uncultured Alistipes sp. TaxID=538949 RepID=UPI0025E77607|nr:lipocalin family protein [uncultured Alistipes sp.]